MLPSRISTPLGDQHARKGQIFSFAHRAEIVARTDAPIVYPLNSRPQIAARQRELRLRGHHTRNHQIIEVM
jgi:hypothetical protein